MEDAGEQDQEQKKRRETRECDRGVCKAQRRNHRKEDHDVDTRVIGERDLVCWSRRVGKGKASRERDKIN